MVLPVFFIANMGRIIPIVVGIGSALFGFVAKNPKIIGATVSLQAISNAIQSLGATEKEKIDIVNDIGKENPQLKYDLYRNIFYPHTDLVSNIAPYLLVFVIVYLIMRK